MVVVGWCWAKNMGIDSRGFVSNLIDELLNMGNEYEGEAFEHSIGRFFFF